jgi:hypothetical protein
MPFHSEIRADRGEFVGFGPADRTAARCHGRLIRLYVRVTKPQRWVPLGDACTECGLSWVDPARVLARALYAEATAGTAAERPARQGQAGRGPYVHEGL